MPSRRLRYWSRTVARYQRPPHPHRRLHLRHRRRPHHHQLHPDQRRRRRGHRRSHPGQGRQRGLRVQRQHGWQLPVVLWRHLRPGRRLDRRRGARRYRRGLRLRHHRRFDHPVRTVVGKFTAIPDCPAPEVPAAVTETHGESAVLVPARCSFEELSALRTGWQAAHSPTAPGNAPLECHALFAMSVHRLQDWVARSGCRPDEHRGQTTPGWTTNPTSSSTTTWQTARTASPSRPPRAGRTDEHCWALAKPHHARFRKPPRGSTCGVRRGHDAADLRRCQSAFVSACRRFSPSCALCAPTVLGTLVGGITLPPSRRGDLCRRLADFLRTEIDGPRNRCGAAL